MLILRAGNQFVKIVDIGLEVLAMVEREGLVADHRGEGFVGEVN